MIASRVNYLWQRVCHKFDFEDAWPYMCSAAAVLATYGAIMRSFNNDPFDKFAKMKEAEVEKKIEDKLRKEYAQYMELHKTRSP